MTKDDLQKMCLKNISLAKEYVKAVEDSFSSVHVFFENELQYMVLILRFISHGRKFIQIKKWWMGRWVLLVMSQMCNPLLDFFV